MSAGLVNFPKRYFGQERLTQEIQQMIYNGHLPRFIILEGSKGSGRRTLARELIAQSMNATFIECETGVDAVRAMTEKAYKMSEPTVYFIDDADGMSTAAKNALLKVTEEPPNNAYFVLALVNRENTLGTIKSRAITFPMEPYSTEQLRDYWYSVYGQWEDRWGDIAGYVRNFGDLQYFAEEFEKGKSVVKFAKTVLENVATVSGTNALKIADYFNLGNEPDKFDPEFFLHVFKVMCYEKLTKTGDPVMAKWILITCRAERQMGNYNLTVWGIMDTWMFELRSAAR